MKLGVLLDSFRTPWERSLDAAKALGLDGVQINVARGELAYDQLKGQRLADLQAALRARDLRVSALCGDLGTGFGDAVQNPALIEKSERMIDLAAVMGVGVVTTHIGVVPSDKAHPRYAVMRDACGSIAAYAGKRGVAFAVETGPETAKVLRAFLDDLSEKGMAVNFDPANFVMVTGDDPVKAVGTLGKYIAHVHAKDGKRLYYKDPEVVYGIVHEDVVTDASFLETPLGEGDVDFDGWLKALRDVGYDGYLTIEREVGDEPAKDIALAADFLRARLRV